MTNPQHFETACRRIAATYEAASADTIPNQPTACTECERLAEALEEIDRRVSHGKLGDWSIALNEIRDIARSALASHTVRLIDGGSS